jgi:phage terminase small subunit
LTDQQKAFVEAYLTNGYNAIQAANTAKYANPDANAYRIRRIPEVAAEIKDRLSEQVMDAEEVGARLALIARSSVSDVFQAGTGGEGPSINWKAILAAPVAYTIKSIRSNPDGSTTLAMHDKASLLLKLHSELSENISPEELEERLASEGARIRAHVLETIRAHVKDPETLAALAAGLAGLGRQPADGPE